MFDTYTSYQLIMRDMNQSISRVKAQPSVQRETEYYLANIGKVTSVDEFLKDTRLFNYAMKAHGLEDMAYAKAFMRKALEEGLENPDSFANKLNDKRYADFVRSFNFAELGKEATTFNLASKGTADRYLIRATPPGGEPAAAFVAETAYYMANIKDVKTIEQFLDSDRLLLYALQAFGLEASFNNKDFIEKILAGGTEDPESLANKQTNEAWVQFAKSFNFERYGEMTTSFNLAQQPSVDKFLRQTLEQNAGEQNEGVRLALYFERKAPGLTSAYQILGDPALGKVVRTILRLPESIVQLDVDKQAALIESRINLEDFDDPKKLSEFLTRFTAIWEMENPTFSPQSAIVSLFQPAEFGISTDLLMTIQNMRR